MNKETDLEHDVATVSETEHVNIETIAQQNSVIEASLDSDETTLEHASKSIDQEFAPGFVAPQEGVHESPSENSLSNIFANLQLSKQPAQSRNHATFDLLTTMFCFAAVHVAYLGSLDFTSNRTIVLLGSLVCVFVCLLAGGAYESRERRSLNSELTNLALCWLSAFAAIGLFAFLTKTAGEVSRGWITGSMILSIASLAGVRIFSRLAFMSEHKTTGRKVVICGSAMNINAVTSTLHAEPNSRTRVARIFEFSPSRSEDQSMPYPIQNTIEQLLKFIENQRKAGSAVEQVWIAVSSSDAQLVEELSERLINSSVDVCVVPDPYTERLLNGNTIRLGNSKIVNISDVSLSPAADRFKRVFDFLLASIGLIVLAIPLLAIAALVKVNSPGPALFRQKRYGIDGKEIEVLKFRSMYVHTDSKVQQATKGDARITRVGKFLRSTSLDELPQLLNVLRGSMSLVGPRPHAVAHNELWRTQINGYMLRHKVRPGITGWAQVNGWRGETDKAYKMQKRVIFDLEYIRTWSPLLDVKIIFMTVFKGFRGANAY